MKAFLEQKARDHARHVLATLSPRASQIIVRQIIRRLITIALLVMLLMLGLNTISRAQAPLQLTKCPGGLGDVAELATAITLANGDDDQDIILMPSNCIYRLKTLGGNDGETALPTITKPLIIVGNNSTIERFAAAKFRLLRTSANLTMSDLVLTDGDLSTIAHGGAILAEAGATLTLTNMTLEDNRAIRGGAIAAIGDVVARDVDFIRNEARTDHGGAIAIEGDLILNHVFFSSNKAKVDGGAIYIIGGNATLQNCSFNGNASENNGGAITGMGGGTLHLASSNFFANQAAKIGGALFIEMTTVIDRTTFERNKANISGGALFHSKALTVTKGHFRNNIATTGTGGAIASFHPLTLRDSVLTANTATIFDSALYLEKASSASSIVNNLWLDNGAPDSANSAIWVADTGSGEVVIRHNTFVQTGENNRRAVSVSAGKVLAQNNIMVNHASALVVLGGTVSSDHNLYFANSEDESGNINSTNNFTGEEPRFADPSNQDYRLQTNSFAIDKAAPSDTLVDARGIWRNGEGILPDIGAFEVDQHFVPPAEIFTLNNCPNGIGDVAELEAALQQANLRPGVNRLVLPANCLYTLVEPKEADELDHTAGLSVIRDPLEIVGNGATIRRRTEITTSFRLLTALQTSLWLNNLTLENGSSNFGAGALAVINHNQPMEMLVVNNVTFRNHHAVLGAGAILANHVDILVNDSRFENNRADGEPGIAGAIFASYGKLEVNRSIFVNNSVSNLGGAIVVDSSPLTIHNSTFDRNSSQIGGAVYVYNSLEPSVWTNNVWINNRATGFAEGFAVKAAAIYLTRNNSLTLLHNTFVHSLVTDAAAIVADEQPQGTETVVRNSIFVNFGSSITTRHPLTNPVLAEQNLFHNTPLVGEGFVGDPLFVDAANHDYHLQTLSPAVDNGIDVGVTVDRELVPRPFNGRFDIGAFEYVEADQPNEPDDPENPDEPDDPENPDEPDDPENPDEPDDPENPDEPDDPENPDEPDDPENPNEPDDPENPGDDEHRLLLPMLKH